VIYHNEKLSYRLVDETDAEFIIELRTNPKLNKFLNYTSNSIEDQISWIKNYKYRESKSLEFYFMFLEDGIRKGTYRLYNINSYSFTIGSWLFNSCNNKLFPIYSDLLMADYGFYQLNKEILLFDVRKKNKKVINYHKLKNPIPYSEDDDNIFYFIQKKEWNNCKKNILDYFGIK